MFTFEPSDITVSYQPPPDYASALDSIAPGITQLAATQQTEGESWLDAIERLLPVLVATKAQRDLLDVQLDRAKAGLPPVDTSQYGLGVQVGASDKTLMTVLAVAALVALAVYLGTRKGR